MLANAVVRRRLEAQGFCDLDEPALAEIGPWLRWSPAVCAVFMALGTAFASPAILWALAATALFGAIFPAHPFDLLYNGVVRHLTGTRPLPRNGAQRRFACAIAFVWLTATGLAFALGATVLGYVLGAALTAAATLVAITHFCIPSWVYNKLFRPPPTAKGPVPRGA